METKITSVFFHKLKKQPYENKNENKFGTNYCGNFLFCDFILFQNK